MGNQKSKTQEYEGPRVVEDERRPHDEKKTSHWKIAILGAGETGKWTLWKQLSLWNRPVRNNECLLSMQRLYDDALTSMAHLCVKLDEEEKPWPILPENEDAFKYFINRDGPAPDAKALVSLWREPKIQHLYQQNIAYTYKNTNYCMGHLIRLAKGTPPENDDYFYTRRFTSGIYEATVTIENMGLKFFTTAGSIRNRGKVNFMLNQIDAIIFMVSAMDYNLPMYDDPTQHRMKYSLDLFQNMLSTPILGNIPIFLCINHIDRLQEKIYNFPFYGPDCFPDVPDVKSYEAVLAIDDLKDLPTVLVTLIAGYLVGGYDEALAAIKKAFISCAKDRDVRIFETNCIQSKSLVQLVSSLVEELKKNPPKSSKGDSE